jgi:hypothetical protein
MSFVVSTSIHLNIGTHQVKLLLYNIFTLKKTIGLRILHQMDDKHII